ncbi:MAG: N-acetyl-gamma-glutamyl-phosphate reductase [Gammaproteobacteria bacterium]|nr:N-acetyl-gamma-glutamyl-phosphate reductase [Gammaproteobacteria bacterium]
MTQTVRAPIKAAIIGANGYGGLELLRILAQHPHVQLQSLVSRSEAGKKGIDIFPHLRGNVCDEMEYVSPTDAQWDNIDVCFFATPHTVAMGQAARLLSRGIKIIDLSADFRIKDQLTWEQWYATRHTEPELIEQAIYGLPELNRTSIKTASLIACPGCYPTSIQLGLMPLLNKNILTDDTIIADSKSGMSGAGRSANITMLYSERAENFEAYAATGHRHYPEIKQQLSLMKGDTVDVIFTPHLLPTVRGIHSTIYAKLADPGTDVQKLFEDAYADEPFISVLPKGSHPQTKSVSATNNVHIAIARPPNSHYVTILVVEDNLIKGAAGQAVQCMNIMYNIDETSGLTQLAAI